jgi:Cytochrome P460
VAAPMKVKQNQLSTLKWTFARTRTVTSSAVRFNVSLPGLDRQVAQSILDGPHHIFHLFEGHTGNHKGRAQCCLSRSGESRKTTGMRQHLLPIVVAVGLIAAAAVARIFAEQSDDSARLPTVLAQLPPGYRDWKLISVAHEEGDLNDLRAILGNDIAIAAFRGGTLPFPDGAIIARLAWRYLPSEENNKAFGRTQSFVSGPPVNVQFMVKDSKKYASTGGWGYVQFNDGKPLGTAVARSCFSCHQAVESRDFVFTRYSP